MHTRPFSLVFLLAGVALFPSGCATLLHSDHQSIRIFSEPGEAKVVVDDRFHLTTAGTVNLSRFTDHIAVIEKDGYEPVWAIGTGHAASPKQIDAVHRTIRACVARKWGRRTADRLRILYGGSVKPDNIVDFLGSVEIDGALVGSACLNPRSFARIIARTQLVKQ